jgi:hypothetical protein
MTLPSGRLQLVGHNAVAVFFIDPARRQRADDTVTVRVYRVFSRSFAGFGESLQSVSDWSVDCRTMVLGTLGEQVFDEGGKFRFWSEPEKATPLEPGSAPETVAKVVCGDVAPPSLPLVEGGPPLVGFSQALLAASPAGSGRASGVRLIGSPSGAQLAGIAGRQKRSVAATVQLLCVGGPHGTLAACAVSDEIPAESSLGLAVLSLTGAFRVEASEPDRYSTEGAVFPIVVVIPKPGSRGETRYPWKAIERR